MPGYSTSGYWYRSGPQEFGTPAITTTGNAVAIGDAIMSSSGALLVLTAGNKPIGVSLEAKASSPTTAIKYIKALPGRTKWVGTAKSGTVAAADKHTLLDMVGTTGAMGIAADTSSNDDFFVDEILSTGSSGQVVLYFADSATLNATN
jgi:hypothetical protein